ncbi:hypothetical protein FKM82_023021 [Ascaphus truei]
MSHDEKPRVVRSSRIVPRQCHQHKLTPNKMGTPILSSRNRPLIVGGTWLGTCTFPMLHTLKDEIVSSWDNHCECQFLCTTPSGMRLIMTSLEMLQSQELYSHWLCLKVRGQLWSPLG